MNLRGSSEFGIRYVVEERMRELEEATVGMLN
jgi:hypothetical protein